MSKNNEYYKNTTKAKYFLQGVIFPSFAAIIEKCLLHPLDTIITLQQSSSKTQSVWTITKELSQQSVKQGLYKGFSTPILLGSIPVQISKYGSYNFAKTYFIDQGYNTTHSMSLACITSAFLTTSIFTPIEAKRTRDTLNIKVSAEYSYKIQNLYRGGSAVFLKSCFHMPISLMGTEILQKYINQESGLAFLFSGIITGAFTQIFTTPLDVLKTKIMQDVYAEKNIFQHTKDVLYYSNPFHSIFARSVRMGLSTGIIFSSMHLAKIISNNISEYNIQSIENINDENEEKNKKLSINSSEKEKELRGISNVKIGLSKLEIENNLKLLQQLSKNKEKEFYVEEYVTDINSLRTKFQEWYQKKDSDYYGSIVALYTDDQSNIGHAVLIYAKKMNFGVKLNIIDPMSIEDSIYIEQIKLLLQNLQIKLFPNEYIIMDVIFSGQQDKEYAVCGDISLIILQELIESKEEHITNKYSSIIDKEVTRTQISNLKLLKDYKLQHNYNGEIGLHDYVVYTHNNLNLKDKSFLFETIYVNMEINQILSNKKQNYNVDNEEKFVVFINNFFIQTELKIENDLLIGDNFEFYDYC